MIKKIQFILLFVFVSQTIWAQQESIKIEVKNQPLNLVLVELRDQYNFSLTSTKWFPM
jgi:hypothetical protein